MSTSRRQFLERTFSASCGLYATLMFAPAAARRAYGQEVKGDVLGRRPFGRIEKLADGVWALISTPFDAAGGAGDRRTHSNGGLIVGTDRILAVDSYRTAEGARYMADACRFLTGRLPTHVVNTHFHFDHLGGTTGLMDGGAAPEVIMTQTTRELAFSTYTATTDIDDEGFAKSAIGKWGGRLTDATRIIVDESQPLALDLGGRTVTITPMAGHTGSDLVIRDDSSGVTFGGDLIWDGIFPNYMSSTPSEWKKSVDAVLAGDDRLIVPGHGGVQSSASQSMQQFARLHDEVEVHARAEFAKGTSADEAAATFSLSEKAGDWEYFRAGFHEIAMQAWWRELPEKDRKNTRQ